MNTSPEYDVIVIGGGPGGSTAGAFLAQAGKRVLILEKETFPRFHIGESLLPFGNDVLKASGAWPKIEAAGFMVKRGAEFTLGNATRFNQFWFHQGLTPGYDSTFQVERAKFDHILLRHAAACGCEVREQTTATAVTIDKCGVAVGTTGDTFRGRWLIDASGRDTFAGRHLKLERRPVDIPKRIAVYAHFFGVHRNPGDAAGHITIVRLRDGWFWFIPLADAKTSVGMVRLLDDFDKSRETMEQWFNRTVSESTALQERMQNAELTGDFRATSDYSYRFEQLAGERLVVVGDAAGFVDPIFSSGVFIALRSGQRAARCIAAADERHRGLTAAEQRRYTRALRKWVNLYVDMIQMFYHPKSFEVFMQPRNNFGLVQTVNSLLAGNTNLRFRMWWRVKLFYFLCRLQRVVALVPRLDYTDHHPGSGCPATKAAVAPAPQNEHVR